MRWNDSQFEQMTMLWQRWAANSHREMAEALANGEVTNALHWQWVAAQDYLQVWMRLNILLKHNPFDDIASTVYI